MDIFSSSSFQKNPGLSCTYLRLSVTDRCCFSCSYCRCPQDGYRGSDRRDLSEDELLRLVELLCLGGVRHVRLTGGEPLMYPGIATLARRIKSIPSAPFLSLTTNAFYFRPWAVALRSAGIDRVNMSLDTLDRHRFIRLTGMDGLDAVRDSVALAASLGFPERRINTVFIRGFNDDEVTDLADFALTSGADIRFIECFPAFGVSSFWSDRFVANAQVHERLEKHFGGFEFLGQDPCSGPACYYQPKTASGRVGFISSVTDFFCSSCSRLRLTSEGRLYLCLHTDDFTDLRPCLQMRQEQALFFLKDVISHKRVYHKNCGCHNPVMPQIGG